VARKVKSMAAPEKALRVATIYPRIMNLPTPLEIPWTMKPLDSAVTGVEHLDDGRLRFSIRHDTVRRLTPEQVCWWFRNIGGDMEVEGRRVSRYRLWHPRDHVSWALRRQQGPEIGPGAIFHIRECFGRDPRWTLDIDLNVIRLDAGGFATVSRKAGVIVSRMEYHFTRVPGGTLYENSLTVGIERAPRINALLLRRVFTEERGRAWLLHNVEEVGNLEHFLPGLIARQG
jgi:hypothetical protein